MPARCSTINEYINTTPLIFSFFDNFFQILDGAFDEGVAAVTVHGRTVDQRYVGASRWSFLREVKQHVGERTILGSGDLFTAGDCLEMIRQTGVDGVTVARGAIGNPWIFKRTERYLATGELLPEPTVGEKVEVAIRHLHLSIRAKGEYKGVREMRRHLNAYVKGMRGEARRELMTEEEPARVEEILRGLLVQHEEISIEEVGW